MVTTTEKVKIKLNSTVANRHDANVVGKLKRIKRGIGYILCDGAKSPIKVKMEDLIVVKVGRTAKADAPKDKGDTPAHPAHITSSKPTTSKIQIIILGTIRGPNWRAIKRSFDFSDGSNHPATDYLSQFELVEISEDGLSAKIKEPAEADVRTNYDINKILKAVEPKAPLPLIIHQSDLSQRPLVMPKPKPVDDGEPGVDEGRGVSIKRTKSTRVSKNGNLIPLKVICRDIDLDPREARMKLRSGVKNKKIPHEPQGRWEWSPDEVDDIKAFLRGDTMKSKAAKDIVAKKNEDEALATAQKVKPSKKAEREVQRKKDHKIIARAAAKAGKSSLSKVKRSARKGVKLHSKR